MAVMNTVALIIGYIFIAMMAALVALAIVSYINDKFRMAFPHYDRWLYDETRRWNAKRRNQPLHDASKDPA